MGKIMIGLFYLGMTTLAFGQIVKTEELSEVTLYATNYKYLNDVNTDEVASVPVELLERKVASYNVKDSDFYRDEFGVYEINFYIPQGTILAAYDVDGKLLHTAERFKDINLPKAVKKAVLDKYPKWTVTKDIYLVNYKDGRGADKTYKLKLENGDKTIRVKLDEKGNYL